MKADKCEPDSNAIAFYGGAMIVDARTGVTMTYKAAASADGRKRNTWNLSANYSYSMGGYTCTRRCAKVTMASYSGWFEI